MPRTNFIRCFSWVYIRESGHIIASQFGKCESATERSFASVPYIPKEKGFHLQKDSGRGPNAQENRRALRGTVGPCCESGRWSGEEAPQVPTGDENRGPVPARPGHALPRGHQGAGGERLTKAEGRVGGLRAGRGRPLRRMLAFFPLSRSIYYCVAAAAGLPHCLPPTCFSAREAKTSRPRPPTNGGAPASHRCTSQAAGSTAQRASTCSATTW